MAAPRLETVIDWRDAEPPAKLRRLVETAIRRGWSFNRFRRCFNAAMSSDPGLRREAETMQRSLLRAAARRRGRA